MKISLQTAFAPVSKSFAQPNMSAPVSYPKNLKTLPDTFEKTVSNVSFKGEESEENEIREVVVEQGTKGIISTLGIYARSHAYANSHKIPVHQDMDDTMDIYFPLSVCAAPTYSIEGKAIFPDEDEFVLIIKNLWNDSNKLEGADETKYTTDEILRLKESGRQPYIEKYVKDDIGRAMDKFSKRNYGFGIQNEEDVERFAKSLYNDESSRTIKESVTRDVKEKGKDSKYYDALICELGSDRMLSRLKGQKDVFFGPPRSLKERYEENAAQLLAEYRAAIERLEREYSASEDNRTLWEKAFDEGRIV